MFLVWLATVSLLLRETYLLLFVIYFLTTILFVNKNDMKLKKLLSLLLLLSLCSMLSLTELRFGISGFCCESRHQPDVLNKVVPYLLF